MNIGIVVDNEFNSDIRVRKEAKILQEAGYNVFVLCFGFNNKIYEDIAGVQTDRIYIKKKTKDIIFFLFNSIPVYEEIWQERIKKWLSIRSIDVLHVHDLYMAKSAGLAVKKIERDIPLILDLHENYPYAVQAYNWTKGILRSLLAQPKTWLKKEKEYLSYATKFIVLSEDYKRDLLQRYSFLKRDNIIIFPNVIDLRTFEQYTINKAIEKNTNISFLYFGAVAERRGIFDTIQVFEKALEQKHNLELIIIGPIDKIDKEKFIKAIANPKVKTHIKYIPWIDISELPTYLYISDICLSPIHKNKQHESGVANKIFQYMYGERPIIVSNCKPQKNLIEQFNCGLSYATHTEYLECMLKLATDQNLREKMGKNGKQELYKNYDNQEFKNVLLNLYRSIK